MEVEKGNEKELEYRLLQNNVVLTKTCQESPCKEFTDKEYLKVKENSNGIFRTGIIAGNTAAGIGMGVVAGMGAVIAVAAAEILVPAVLVLKAFGLTGGAMGFLRGMKKSKKS